MKLWRIRTEMQWSMGLWAVLLLVLALVLGAMTVAQLDKIDLRAQQLSTQLQPRAVQPSDLRVQLDRLRRLEAELMGARSTAEVQAYTEQIAEQLERFKELEARFTGLLDSSEERLRFAAYSTSRNEYLQWQQQILELARTQNFRSRESMKLTIAALAKTYGSESQNSFAAAASALEQWQQDNAESRQEAGALARQLAASTRDWMLWALAGATLLALALALGLLLLLARSRSAEQARASPFRRNAGRRQSDCNSMGPDSDWRDTRTLLQARQEDWLNLRADTADLPDGSHSPAAAGLSPQTNKTSVTAEDWDSF